MQIFRSRRKAVIIEGTQPLLSGSKLESLENASELPENALVNAVKVDEAHRIQVSALQPGEYYEPEVLGDNAVLLRKVTMLPRKLTFEEAMAKIEGSPLRFTKSWDEVKKETR